jgi:hypothetical protein
MRAMRATLVLAALPLVVLAAPTAAGSLQVFESAYGAPGATANLPPGPGSADLDLDADSAEGGGLAQGATEIELRPTGSVVFVDFVCELPGCARDVDYVFTPGDATSGGRVIVSDAEVSAQHGTLDLGQLTLDGDGGVELVGCNYIGVDGVERRCDAFSVATLPEPGVASGLALGAVLLLTLRRRA